MRGSRPSKRAVPGELLVLGGFGVGLGEPELGDLVLACDQLFHVLAGGVVLVQHLEAVVSTEIVLPLELGLGEVVLAVFADGRPLAVLGDLGEFLLGLGEFSLLEEGVGGVELGFGHRVLGGLAMGRQPSEPRIRVEPESPAAPAAPASCGREPAIAAGYQTRSTMRSTSAISSLVGPATRLPS